MQPSRNGLVHLYTGDGKGKTTAAIGLAVRAMGAGRRVFFGQFIKGREYSELKALRRFGDDIRVEQFGRGCFIRGKPSPEDVSVARAGLDVCARVMAGGRYALVILDEVCVAIHVGLLEEECVLDAVDGRAEGVEVVLTGRFASGRLVDAADLVTRMEEVKHYYASGVPAREGIEY